LKLAVEEAIYEAAPDVTGIVVHGAVLQEVPPSGFVPLANLQGHNLPRNQDTAGVEWEDVFGLERLPSGGLRTEEVAGQAILFCRLEETFYAYNNSCPGCGQPLGASRLEGRVLACSICNLQYDVVRAGRGVDLTNLHLEPVPLLTQNGRARIALESSRIQRSAK
jgi:nitrite reductase/ring-hydroxylating ferredoxin subunit